MNLCENIWNHELAMRRLLSLLRNSQSACTDAECFQFSQPNTGDNGVMMMTLCWLAIAFFLNMFRPSSLRNQEHDLKPHNNGGNGEGRDPPASPNAF
uniref:Small integral membrane protein 14 n=1 Tax=Cimex lectularius TaxID=79782 RepID=D1FPP1_CIMLE